MSRVAAILVFALVATSVDARAQDAVDPVAARRDAMIALERSQRGERADSGIVLLSYGLASMVAGGVAAGVGHEDSWWLGAGLGTLAWGTINAALAIPLFDPFGRSLARIEEDRAITSLGPRYRELERAQRGSATFFALNVGLDVFYLATGALLVGLAHALEPDERMLAGYGAAMALQGAGLFAFDLVEMIHATERADQWAAIADEED